MGIASVYIYNDAAFIYQATHSYLVDRVPGESRWSCEDPLSVTRVTDCMLKDKIR